MLKTDQLVDEIRNYAVKFSIPTELQPLIKVVSNATYVLLGEASHGMSEFYTISLSTS